jgi:hypothetical protein
VSGDEHASREREASIQAARQPDVRGVARYADAWVSNRAEHRGGTVGRAVIDDEKLEIAERLAEHGVDGLAEMPLAIEDRHQHRHPRRGLRRTHVVAHNAS